MARRCIAPALAALVALLLTSPPTARAAPAAPRTGTLKVTSSPLAQVFVEGEAVGLTPLRGHALRPGRHRVELRIADGRSHVVTVTIKAGVTVTVAQVFGPPRRGAPGTLVVTSEPWAQIFLDGRAVGTTPLTGYRAASRSYNLELRTTDGKRYQRLVYVEAGRTTRLHHRFPKETDARPAGPAGWLRVNSHPPATVFVDGKRAGPTPLTDHEVAVGLHAVELKTADGRTHRRQLHVARDKTTQFLYRFPPKEEVVEKPRIGHLSVASNVEAEVLIDGKNVGWTPLLEHPLKPGRHRVTVVASKRQRRSYTVVVVVGRTRTMMVNFARR